MKMQRPYLYSRAGHPLALAALLTAVALAATAVEKRAGAAPPATTPSPSPASPKAPERPVAIETIEVIKGGAPRWQKDSTWLGVAASEASEALAAQLDLQPGVGLIVEYVAPESPAAKAGLKKNDVLARLGDQSLVHPTQLRKLVQMHSEGDVIELVYYRGGKQRTASVTLAKAAPTAGWPEIETDFQDGLRGLGKQFRELHLDRTIRDQLGAARDALGNLKLDQKKVQAEVRRSMDQARKAMQDALRQMTNAHSGLGPARKALEELTRSKLLMNNHATVTVRSTGHGTRSIVKTDNDGTIVIVANPKPHLTAHDRQGQLLFDGEIDTADQQKAVPHELWRRVEPLLDKLGPVSSEQPEEPETE